MLKDIKGLGPKTLQKLQTAGILTLEALAIQDPKVMEKRTGITETIGTKIITQARLMLKETMAMDFIPGSLAAKILEVPTFSSGIRSLDKILGGGIRASALYEWVGPARGGKTTICSQCCVTVQLPPEGHRINVGKDETYLVRGRGGPAIWIDTEKTFRPNRIRQIAKRFGLDPKVAVDSISYVSAVNSQHVQWLIEERLPFILDSTGAKLIVVDSLIRHFGAEFIGRETLARRQQILSRLLQILLEYAAAYKATVFYTNQIRANPTPYGAPTKPAGGNILSHAATYRVKLRARKGEERVAKIMDAPDLPEEEAIFILTDLGLSDGTGTGIFTSTAPGDSAADVLPAPEAPKLPPSGSDPGTDS